MSTALALKNITSLVNSGIMYVEIQLGNSDLIAEHLMIGDLSSHIKYIASYFSIRFELSNLLFKYAMLSKKKIPGL